MEKHERYMFLYLVEWKGKRQRQTMLSTSHFGVYIRFSSGSVIPKEKLKIEPLNMIKKFKIHNGEHDWKSI
jgi:hypothetical protein